MKNQFTQPNLNQQAFNTFVKSCETSQHQVLLDKGILLDIDKEGTLQVNLYFLDGFFVEEIICNFDNTIIEIVPYKTGYKLESFLEMKHEVITKHFRQTVNQLSGGFQGPTV